MWQILIFWCWDITSVRAGIFGCHYFVWFFQIKYTRARDARCRLSNLRFSAQVELAELCCVRLWLKDKNRLSVPRFAQRWCNLANADPSEVRGPETLLCFVRVWKKTRKTRKGVCPWSCCGGWEGCKVQYPEITLDTSRNLKFSGPVFWMREVCASLGSFLA